jgi:hypothetical protein
MYTLRLRSQHRGPGQASTYKSDADPLGRTRRLQNRAGAAGLRELVTAPGASVGQDAQPRRERGPRSVEHVVVGFVGGALQLAVLLLALVRGLRARSLAGGHDRLEFLMLSVTRASLPLMEISHSPVTYGAAVRFAAWLAIPNPRRAPALRPTRRGTEVAAV